MEKLLIGTGLMDCITQGLYHNPLNIYREYIQNAADSIDEAERLGILEHGKGEITIDIQPEERKIVISDNGTGILSSETETRLYSIGASLKDRDTARGFRGIGHFCGIAFCDTLSFITSAKGESTKITLTFDAAKARKERLSEDKDLVSLMNEITKITKEAEATDAHYFTVEMSGVVRSASDHGLEVNLLDTNFIKEYLVQSAPIDFNPQKFFFANKIKREFLKRDYVIPCYKIILSGQDSLLYKPYTSEIFMEKRKEPQRVLDVETVYEIASDGKPLYIGWLALSDFQKVTNKTICGIRFRKGNILVGNEDTFSGFIPEGQDANQCFMGEIHVLHPGVVVNSERVNFERTAMYDEMCQKLTVWAKETHKKYRRGMADINIARKKITETTEKEKYINDDIESGRITPEEAKTKQEKYNKIKSQCVAKLENILQQKTLDFNPERKQEIQTLIKETNSSVSEKPCKKIPMGKTKQKTEANIYYREQNEMPWKKKVIACIKEVIPDIELAEKLIEKIKDIE